jgi:hypothetical protein
MRLKGLPDFFNFGRQKIPVASTGWSETLVPQWDQGLKTPESFMSLDLSDVSFLTLSELVYAASLIDRIVSDERVLQFDLDLLGKTDMRLIPVAEFISFRKRPPYNYKYTSSEIDFSADRYRLAGFLESLGVLDILNRPNRRAKVIYPGMSKEAASFLSFYGGPNPVFEKPTVVLGLQRIDSKADCRQFLDESQIHNWRTFMDERFRRSPLFESEELWKVLCHELAVNIWEHSGVSGFIAARVIESPLDYKGSVRKWCQASYPRNISQLFPKMKDGFLELCVADAGHGFITTLESAYRSAIVNNGGRVGAVCNPCDVLAFAFDELGTSKGRSGGWATGRHALWRILRLTAKYGGILRLRSGRGEVTYMGESGWFDRCPNHLGYAPQEKRLLKNGIIGAQMQLILPLIPRFRQGEAVKRTSVLDYGLPSTFKIQSGHSRGHLVPLLEKLDQPEASVGAEEQSRFKSQCEKLARKLMMHRPRTEPVILDFDNLNWTPAQFEALLYFLQNVLQSRPVLLVEIEPELARAAVELQRQSGATTLTNEVVSEGSSAEYFEEISETRYLETYIGVHSSVLGIDRNGDRYIFGVPAFVYEEALLSLMEEPKDIEAICREFKKVQESILRAILTPVNCLFVLKENKWELFWDLSLLAIETTRVMSRHFDVVAERCEAWRGRISTKDGSSNLSKSGQIFHLPWLDEWRSEFLEASRILSRERHADEVAQRLIYRLDFGLRLNGKSLDDVKVFACMTAPAMLLASALHRWWPNEHRPAIADLGYYIVFSNPHDVPAVVTGGGVVLVQDVLDTGYVSRTLLDVLRAQSIEVLCILSFVRFVSDLGRTRVTSIREGWTNAGSIAGFAIPSHALIEVARPKSCEAPADDADDSNAFWVEPRALRPVRYPTLRREFPKGRDTDLDRRDTYLKRFDDDCLLAAGHYVYGRRHYAVAVDIRRVLLGEIGDDIASWLADLCEGVLHQPRAWERDEGRALKGDVTAVLMPVNSQIHYIWPKVSNLLAQRGRRQMVWFLEATLHTGNGPAFRMPPQLQHQLEEAIGQAKERTPSRNGFAESALRILVIDDAIATGRTAETIIGTLLWVTEKLFRQAKKNIETHQSPIRWMRYFAIINQMEQSQHTLWKNLRAVGSPSIPFLFEDFAPFMGVPVYGEENCPVCKQRVQLSRLADACGQRGEDAAREWSMSRYEELRPIAIDSPGFQGANPGRVKAPIDILASRPTMIANRERYVPLHTDTAIWRFYELMYLSYPPSDILRSLASAYPREGDTSGIVFEYERYRWAVLEWCLRNWPRLIADTARTKFIECAKKEVEVGSALLEPLLEGCSVHSDDTYICCFVEWCLEKLIKLELQRSDPYFGAEEERIKKTVLLENSMNLFYMGLHLDGTELAIKDDLLLPLRRAVQQLAPIGPTFVHNLFKRVTRKQRYADPQWAIETLAESLFRGRDKVDSRVGNHQLLPRLITSVLRHPEDQEDRRLLHSSLTLFAAALEDIDPYCDMKLADGAGVLKHLVVTVLGWLKYPIQTREAQEVPEEIRDFEEILDLDSPFCENFNALFHEEIRLVGESLQHRLERQGTPHLQFEYRPDPSTSECRVLTHVLRLGMFISNYAIDPATKECKEVRSRVCVSVRTGEWGASRVVFRILTNFAALAETDSRTRVGRSGWADRASLKLFGATFDEGWSMPVSEEASEGFEAAYEFEVPAGFPMRRKGHEL